MDNCYQLGLYAYKSKASNSSRLPEALKGENMNPSGAVLQLLMGRLSVYDEDEQLVYKGEVNYIRLPYETATEKVDDYTDYQIAFGVDEFDEETTNAINEFLRADFKNRFVYEHVLHEMTLALVLLDKNPTEAFVHIYRMLEFISYSFPLIYTAKANDYRGSFNSLKEYFTGGDGDGELKFFDKFLETLFQDDKEIYDLEFEIYIGTDKADEIISDFKKSIPEKGRKNVDNYYIDGHCLKIRFKKMQAVLIEIRNKYFHMFVGKGTNNFYGIDYDINELFKKINPYFINWLANIYAKIFQYRLETK